jgi:prevent-host-death family protein
MKTKDKEQNPDRQEGKVMKVSTATLKKKLSDLLDRVAETGERVIIVNRGKIKAAIIGPEELEQLQDLDEALATWEDEEGSETITLEELEAELGLTEDETPPTPKKGARKHR